MAITSEEIGITSEVIAINGEEILSGKWSKTAIFEGVKTPLFFRVFQVKNQKGNLCPFLRKK